jgi:hypothetical protein
MNLFRLLIDNKDSLILIEAPNIEILNTLINEPGDSGYHFYEILYILVPIDFTSVSIIDFNVITDNDTIIRWNRLII